MTAAAAEAAACEFCGAGTALVRVGELAACTNETECIKRCRERAAARGAGTC